MWPVLSVANACDEEQSCSEISRSRRTVVKTLHCPKNQAEATAGRPLPCNAEDGESFVGFRGGAACCLG